MLCWVHMGLPIENTLAIGPGQAAGKAQRILFPKVLIGLSYHAADCAIRICWFDFDDAKPGSLSQQTGSCARCRSWFAWP